MIAYLIRLISARRFHSISKLVIFVTSLVNLIGFYVLFRPRFKTELKLCHFIIEKFLSHFYLI